MDDNIVHTEHKLEAGPPHRVQNYHTLHTCPVKDIKKQTNQVTVIRDAEFYRKSEWNNES